MVSWECAKLLIRERQYPKTTQKKWQKKSPSDVTHTGCFTISVKSETPLFLDICWRSRLSFYVVNGQCGRFDFLKKNFEIFDFVKVRARYKLSLVFRLSQVCSKFKFSVGIQLFGLKTTLHGKPDLKNSFSRSDLRHSEVQGEVGVQGHPVFQHLPVLCR